jgi:uncharacterized protein YwgA
MNKDLVYSDDLCCAIMAAVVSSHDEQFDDNHQLGRTAMQKLIYFAKVLGVPVPCAFEIYTYGPYSETVTFSVDSLLADEVLKDTSGRLGWSNYRLGENASKLLDRYDSTIGPYKNVIDAVVKSLATFKPQELELVATLHFIYHRLRQIFRRDPEQAEVIQEFRRIKKEKFTQDQIESFYSALQRANLIASPSTAKAVG